MSSISVKIGGVEYKASDHYTIQQQAGAISVSDIDVLMPATASVPVAKQAVQIFNDGNAFFYGFISSVETPEYSTGLEVQRYRLEINSAESVLKNRLVTETFSGVYTHDIVQSLFENYISEEGFEFGAISTTTRYWETWSQSYYNLYDALVELADDVGALFYIAPDKKFYFLLKTDLTQIDMPAHVTKLKRNENADSIITLQTIAGATEETTIQTETFLWDVSNETYQSTTTLSYPVSSITACYIGQKTDTGMSWTSVLFGVKNVDDSDTSVTFLYEESSNTIKLNATAVTRPTSSNPYIKIVYVGNYDIMVTNANETLQKEIAALNGTSGKIEAYTSDSTIKTFADADTAAINLLNENDEWTEEITAKCHSLDDTSLYTAWKIQSTESRISGIYVIVERTIEDFGPDNFFITVKLKNRSLYSRYGTCLKNTTKNNGTDVLIYKTAVYTEKMSFSDSFFAEYEAANWAYYPSSDLTDPMLIDGMTDTTFSCIHTHDVAAVQETIAKKNLITSISDITYVDVRAKITLGSIDDELKATDGVYIVFDVTVATPFKTTGKYGSTYTEHWHTESLIQNFQTAKTTHRIIVKATMFSAMSSAYPYIMLPTRLYDTNGAIIYDDIAVSNIAWYADVDDAVIDALKNDPPSYVAPKCTGTWCKHITGVTINE